MMQALQAQEKVCVNRGNVSAIIRKRNVVLLLTLVLASPRFTHTFSCTYAYAWVVHVNQPLQN